MLTGVLKLAVRQPDCPAAELKLAVPSRAPADDQRWAARVSVSPASLVVRK